MSAILTRPLSGPSPMTRMLAGFRSLQSKLKLTIFLQKKIIKGKKKGIEMGRNTRKKGERNVVINLKQIQTRSSKFLKNYANCTFTTISSSSSKLHKKLFFFYVCKPEKFLGNNFTQNYENREKLSRGEGNNIYFCLNIYKYI